MYVYEAMHDLAQLFNNQGSLFTKEQSRAKPGHV